MAINLVVEEAGVLREEPPTMDKQLANFITCESSAPFFCYLQSRAQTQAVLVTLSHPGSPKVKKNIEMYICVVGIYLFNKIQLKSDSYQLYY
jgi:hypothetical protein